MQEIDADLRGAGYEESGSVYGCILVIQSIKAYELVICESSTQHAKWYSSLRAGGNGARYEMVQRASSPVRRFHILEKESARKNRLRCWIKHTMQPITTQRHRIKHIRESDCHSGKIEFAEKLIEQYLVGEQVYVHEYQCLVGDPPVKTL